MKKTKTVPSPAKYKNHQFAFRMKDRVALEDLQNALKDLYDKFNKGRDPKDPQGTRAVKINDIALKAIYIGMAELKKQKVWDWFESE